jgi:hypothetical protein
MQSSLLNETLSREIPQVSRCAFAIPLVLDFNKVFGANDSKLCDFREGLNLRLAQTVVVLSIPLNVTVGCAGMRF